MKILTHGNYIHFNEKISKQTMVCLLEEIENVNIKIAKTKQQFHTDTDIPIILFINSWGGCLDSVLGACNVIQNNPNPIITIINGQSASAGTMLSIIGHRRLIYPTSYAMVHEGSSYIGGDSNDIADNMHNMEIVEDIVKDMYLKNTILTSKEYDELCIDDKVWDADICLRYGLVDNIIRDPNKLKDWKWLLNMKSHKKKDIKNIKDFRDKMDSKLPERKRKRLTESTDGF